MSGWILLLALLVQPADSIEKGWLRLQTESDVEVVWEGVSLGRTDATGLLLVESIPPGEFTIQLRSPEFESREENVTIDAGRNSISIDLVRSARAMPSPAPVATRESPTALDAPAAPENTDLETPPSPSTGPPPPATAGSEPIATAAAPGEAPLATDTTPSPPESEAGGTGLLLALAALGLSLGAGVLVLRRGAAGPVPAGAGRHTTSDSHPPLREEPAEVRRPERRVSETPDFLDQIRRREQQLDSSGVATVAETEVVIDVEYREIEGGNDP